MIGATLGFSYLMSTILFANLTFIIDRIVNFTLWSACVFLCFLLVASSAVLYKPLRKELVTFRCLRKMCCPKEGKSKSYRVKKTDDYSM